MARKAVVILVLIAVGLTVLAGTGYGVYSHDTARVRAAREALALAAQDAARAVAGSYRTEAIAGVRQTCGAAEAENPLTIKSDGLGKVTVSAEMLRAAVEPGCVYVDAPVRALRNVPPTGAEFLANQRLTLAAAGGRPPYRLTSVAVEVPQPPREDVTVKVAAEARAGWFRRSIRADATATYRAVPKETFVAALAQAQVPLLEEVRKAAEEAAKKAAEEAQKAEAARRTDGAARRTQPATTAVDESAKSRLATEGLGLPPEVASGTMTFEAWCLAHPEEWGKTCPGWMREVYGTPGGAGR